MPNDDDIDDDDRWFYNDDLYLEYLLALPKPDPANRGVIRYFKGPDLENLRSPDA